MRLSLLVVAFAGSVVSLPAIARDAQIAVAANFTAAAQELGSAFAEETGLEVSFSFGATGQLYAQIIQGAPFDAFLSADAATPTRLVAEGLGESESLFSYAVGRLVLFSVDPDRVTGPEALEGDFANLAIAEPAAAPYGAAAVQTMEALGLLEDVSPRLVVGQNISQTYQFIDTGNAELGFVALSQVMGRADGSRWIVDEDMHDPIAQDAVLLSPDNAAARAFLEFLGSEQGVTIIASFGYSVADR
ncbi:molybdate ABC transporter substrate-binding protein [Pelagibacterium montanilacus]|uniref:molybdate ABC transporter substrate-binding protein n=1 Tax=Pelagibacterium montanilacus TaxID=2185280 RepID=UPI000F8CAA42|nr:molybdate ABC transporter substrate-binding protein [Pelagibacterium montanilacus]